MKIPIALTGIMKELTTLGFPAVFGPKVLILHCSVLWGCAEGTNPPALIHYLSHSIYSVQQSPCSLCQNQTALLIRNLGCVSLTRSLGDRKREAQGRDRGEMLNGAAHLPFAFLLPSVVPILLTISSQGAMK